MPKKSKKTAKVAGLQCSLCLSDVDDEFRFGKLLSNGKIHIHYFCALFACGLPQNGNKSTRLQGFLLKDVLKEINRASRLKCSYCKCAGASIGCCVKKCSRKFHLKCGQNNGASNQYFSQFRSYCKTHKPKQNLGDVSDKQCCICYGKLNAKENVLLATCCTNGYFHHVCLQQYALNAGYFFKCPYCNNNKEFREEMLTFGIFVPDRDASWELEQNAFQELLVRPGCSAVNCLCPEGRDAVLDSDEWDVIYCSNCGSTARHFACEKLGIYVTKWVCPECVSIEAKLKQQKPAVDTDTENCFVDVVGSDDSESEYVDVDGSNDSEAEYVVVDVDGSDDSEAEYVVVDAVGPDDDEDNDVSLYTSALSNLTLSAKEIEDTVDPIVLKDCTPDGDKVDPIALKNCETDVNPSVFLVDINRGTSTKSNCENRDSICSNKTDNYLSICSDEMTKYDSCEVPLVDISSGILNDMHESGRCLAEQRVEECNATVDALSANHQVDRNTFFTFGSLSSSDASGASGMHSNENKKLKRSCDTKVSKTKKKRKRKNMDEKLRTLYDMQFFTLFQQY